MSFRISFTGDIGFDQYMKEAWQKENFLSPSLLSFLMESDACVLNVEGTLSYEDEFENNGKKLPHYMNPEALSVFNGIPDPIYNFANNHSMDGGVDGLKRTLYYTELQNALPLGAGMNRKEASKPILYKEAGGIGILSIAYHGCVEADDEKPGVFSWYDYDCIEDRIQEIKKENRWCVLVIHGGEEFTMLPNPYIREQYLRYLGMGADVIVGHHPHVPMNYEVFENGKMIFYSLGNFIFDTDYQRAQINTDEGVLLKLSFTEDEVTFDAKGLKINRTEEKIEESALPKAFVNLSEEEYELFYPLSALAFIESSKKRMIFLYPERFENAGQEEWFKHFFTDPKKTYRENGYLDYNVVFSYAQKAKDPEWIEKIKEWNQKKSE